MLTHIYFSVQCNMGPEARILQLGLNEGTKTCQKGLYVGVFASLLPKENVENFLARPDYE